MEGTWIRKPTAQTTVVFVHGILSSGDGCWRHENGSYWPELLKSEPELGSFGIYVFTYETGVFSGNYDLSDSVNALKTHMSLDGVFENDKLIFVCHSMGGIVVRKFLVKYASDLQQKKIGLFLIASPSLGSGYANWLKPLARLLGNKQADALRYVRDNPWLSDLDKDFLDVKDGKLSITGKELVEDKFGRLGQFVFWRKQVVEPFSGGRYFAGSYKVPNSNHSSIAKPENRDAIQHRILCDFISDTFLPPQSIKSLDVHSHESLSLRVDISGEVVGGLNAVRHVASKVLSDKWDGSFKLQSDLIDDLRRQLEELEALSTLTEEQGQNLGKLRSDLVFCTAQHECLNMSMRMIFLPAPPWLERNWGVRMDLDQSSWCIRNMLTYAKLAQMPSTSGGYTQWTAFWPKPRDHRTKFSFVLPDRMSRDVVARWHKELEVARSQGVDTLERWNYCMGALVLHNDDIASYLLPAFVFEFVSKYHCESLDKTWARLKEAHPPGNDKGERSILYPFHWSVATKPSWEFDWYEDGISEAPQPAELQDRWVSQKQPRV